VQREQDPKKRVVITGMGIASVFGNNVDTFYDRLLAGESGITAIDRFDTSEYPTRFAGQIKNFECAPHAPPIRETLQSCLAARRAPAPRPAP